MLPQLAFILNLIATWYMVGLIWMVQIVHYNLFDRVGSDVFAAYEADHNRLITPIVGLPMLVEIATAAYLCFNAPEGTTRNSMIAGMVMLGLIWISTAALSVPYHGKLMHGFDADAYRGLVSTNWIRTILWTARGLLWHGVCGEWCVPRQTDRSNRLFELLRMRGL
ncbi:MAG: hypothetical protein AAF664_03940 [Planctomycetota bacterium]